MKRILISLICAISLSLASCGKDSKPTEAARLGAQDAAALCTDSITFTDHEITSALLAVRAREWQMRSRGQESDADAYIAAFRQYIEENNETLAKELF